MVKMFGGSDGQVMLLLALLVLLVLLLALLLVLKLSSCYRACSPSAARRLASPTT